MADTFTKLYIQVVFATKLRAPLLQNSYRDRLFEYIGGILKGHDQIPLAINGTADHIHIFFIYKPHILLSDLIRDVKRDSSAFINANRLTNSTFRWQKSYGAFSYGSSQINRVIRYVNNQEDHHRKKSFSEEVDDLLEHFDAPSNPYGWIE